MEMIFGGYVSYSNRIEDGVTQRFTVPNKQSHRKLHREKKISYSYPNEQL